MEKGGFLTLGIESSCDDTCAAVLSGERDVLSNIVSSQTAIHAKFGGVVPEIAGRRHLQNINRVIDEALAEAGVSLDLIDLVGVTKGPGLAGALVVGVAAAKAIAFARDIPLVGVNHMQGHISANFIDYPGLKPPFLSLVVSGGHTSIVMTEDYGKYTVLGSTRDDAAGEAYDKVARAIGLGYPGGPKIDRAAAAGDPTAVSFKRIYLEKDSFDFSFSGLKTAVLNYLSREKQAGRKISVPDAAAGFQAAVIEVIVRKTVDAAEKTKQKKIALAGGVAANSKLCRDLREECEKRGMELYVPSPALCTDNAAMIACAAFHKYKKEGADSLSLDVYPGLAIGSE